MRRGVSALLFSCLLAFWAPGTVAAQPAPSVANASPAAPSALRVYLDCQSYYCDMDYVRTEVAFVDHVRNREDADVHVLVTAQSTGSGGLAITLRYVGRGRFEKLDDELVATTSPNDSEDLRRREFVRILKLGLVRYAAHTSTGSRLTVSQPAASGSRQTTGAPRGKDPWDYWVFRLSVNQSAYGEASSSSSSISGSASASRTTEAWKLSFYSSMSVRESTYDFGDGEILTTTRRTSSGEGLIVKSLTDHWSVGGKFTLSSSTYSNLKRAVRVAPAIEYDVFRYADATKRQLTFLYTVTLNDYVYHELTLHEKMAETVPSHNLQVALSTKHTWGSLSGDVLASQYLHDTSKRRLDLYGGVSLKLVKGLSVSVSASGGWIHDQIHLPMGSATRDEVLVQLRQLATNYQYSVYSGISYQFGSMFNNVVNPRMSGSSGFYY